MRVTPRFVQLVMTKGRGRGHLSPIIGKALQDNDEPSYRWRNISPLTPYRGVTDTEMKPPLRQHQRLERKRKHLYIYP